MDLLVANYDDNTVILMFGINGQFSANFDVIAVGLKPTYIVSGDFNQDGHIDWAVTNSGDNAVGVALGLGFGFFGKQLIYSVGSNP
ncbi:unnamed protein product, partial [Rotaria magnacalcarata]